ncbi:MAG TPA: FliG C-terminal domain-containing protein [Pirellulales bacterium]|nr:FliG C-terminal domain-containing protein [Pirellulales bacterium]
MGDREEKLRRAAIVVLTLDEATAEKVLAQLPADDAARLRRLMVDLESVDADEERRTLGDFLRQRPAKTRERDWGVELKLSSASSRPDVGANAPAPATEDDKAPFRFLHAARGDKITPFLVGEHPQTIAVVVSHLPDDRAAAVLAQLDGDLQAGVIRRLIDLDQADPEVVREIEVALESRMLEQALAERRQETGLESLERILEAAEPALRRRIVENLTRHSPHLVERFRPPEFEFDDLQRLDESTLATVLAAAGPEITRLALAGADAEFVNRILEPLSPAEAKKMRRMIERIGPVRLSDVEEAQRELARIAREMALEGTIELVHAPSH